MRLSNRGLLSEIRTLNDGNRQFMRDLREENREFMRELTLRHERSTDHSVRRLEDLGEEIRANTQVLRDLHEETLAQRGGMLELIDRIDRLGSGGQA